MGSVRPLDSKRLIAATEWRSGDGAGWKWKDGGAKNRTTNEVVLEVMTDFLERPDEYMRLEKWQASCRPCR